MNPRDAWEAKRDLERWTTGNHKKTDIFRFKLDDGSHSLTDVVHVEVLSSHFEKLYHNRTPIEWTVLHDIPLRYIYTETNYPLTKDEFLRGLQHLCYHKSTSLTGITAEGLKALSDTQKDRLFQICSDLFYGTTDFP